MKRGRKFLAALAVLAISAGLTGFIITTSDPNKVEVVVSDVAHFWQAFDDDASSVLPAARAEVYRKEYFDRASQGLKARIL